MTDFATARTTMVDCQVRPSDVTKYPIIDALLSVPREEFVPSSKRPVAYMGDHIEIGKNRVLLDARTFAKMLDAVNVQSDELVLDLGCGLGYSTAVITRMAEAVVGVEQDEDQAAEATTLLSTLGADNAVVIAGNLTEGAPKHGPYDVVFLQGGAQQIPDAILEQIKTGGRIVAIREENGAGRCKIGYKNGASISWRSMFSASAPVLPGFEKTTEFSFG